MRIANCLKAAAKTLERIECLQGEQKLKNYAEMFKNSLALALHVHEDAQ